MRQVRNANHRLEDHILRALNKIRIRDFLCALAVRVFLRLVAYLFVNGTICPQIMVFDDDAGTSQPCFDDVSLPYAAFEPTQHPSARRDCLFWRRFLRLLHRKRLRLLFRQYSGTFRVQNPGCSGVDGFRRI